MKELNLQLHHIQKSYNRPVLVDINLHVTNDSYITIVGKSGSGKSTLLNILGLVEGYDGGEYRLNNVRIRNYMDYAKLRLENIPVLQSDTNFKLQRKYFIANLIQSKK